MAGLNLDLEPLVMELCQTMQKQNKNNKMKSTHPVFTQSILNERYSSLKSADGR